MVESNDLNPGRVSDLKFESFPHDTLVGLLKLYTRLYLALDGFWYLTVKERLGNDEALACDIAAWRKLTRYEMSRITQFMNITGRDLASFLKALQLTPWLRVTSYQIDVKDEKSATLTVRDCPTLRALEKEGEGREKQICNTVEPVCLKGYASFFSPTINIECVKSPPRVERDTLCCVWSITEGGLSCAQGGEDAKKVTD